MNIDVTYDSSVAGAPAGFTTVVADVVKFYDALFANPITVDIDVGWGEIDGQSLGSGALGESLTNFTDTYYTYGQIKAALDSSAVTSQAKAAVATLPASDPTGDDSIWSVTTAEAKALGLTSATGGIDGYAGFSSIPGTFDFSVTSNTGGSVASGEYDLFGVVAHEFSEIMGRQTNFGVNYGYGPGDGSGYYPLDLFDYSASGVRSFDANASKRYFSINGGVTDLDNFNTDPSGDLFDWAASAGDDAYDAFSYPGVVNSVTATDITLMNVLGYEISPAFSASALSLFRRTLSFTISNSPSSVEAPASTSGVYVVAGYGTPTTADTLLAKVATPAVASGGSVAQSVILPLSSLSPGSYDLDVIADYDGGVTQAPTSADVSPTITIAILDDSNAETFASSTGIYNFVLSPLDLSGELNVNSSLYVAASLKTANDFDDNGAVEIVAGGGITTPRIEVGSTGAFVVDTDFAYGGPFSGPVTVGEGAVFEMTGAGSIFGGVVTGGGTLEIGPGAGLTLDPGTALQTAKVDQTGGAVSVEASTVIAIGVFDQTAGSLTAASGDRIDFTNVGDSFAGTLAGAGTIALVRGSDTLSGTTITGSQVIINGPAVTLAGSIDLSGAVTASSKSLTVADGGATLTGGGYLDLSNVGTNRLAGASASATLTNVDDRIVGAGSLGGGEMTLVNEAGGVINGADPVTLTIDTGTTTIINAGAIDASGTGGTVVTSPIDNTGQLFAAGGNLTLEGAVTGAGVGRIKGATLDAVATFDENVDFVDGTGTLELSDAVAYTATISGFSTTGGTTLDLADFAFSGATASYSGTTTSGVLTVASGSETAAIRLVGDYLSSKFTLSNDGRGGTDIVDPSAAPTSAAASRFVSAMASLPASGAADATGGGSAPASAAQPLFLAPRVVQLA